jgi:hypothetical protein
VYESTCQSVVDGHEREVFALGKLFLLKSSHFPEKRWRMSKRRLMIMVAIIIVVALLVVAAVLATNPGGNKNTTYNSAQIYITDWGMSSPGAPNVNVQFKLYFDLNGDGVYELTRTSSVFTNTSFELAPFHIGTPVDVQSGSFNFKVEVLKISGGTSTVMRYTDNGIIPVCNGVNQIDKSGSWSYSTVSGPVDLNCAIKIVYYVG